MTSVFNQHRARFIPLGWVIAGTLFVVAALLIAHQGGWDEALLVLLPIAFIFLMLYLAKRKADRAAVSPMPAATALDGDESAGGDLKSGEPRADEPRADESDLAATAAENRLDDTTAAS